MNKLIHQAEETFSKFQEKIEQYDDILNKIDLFKTEHDFIEGVRFNSDFNDINIDTKVMDLDSAKTIFRFLENEGFSKTYGPEIRDNEYLNNPFAAFSFKKQEFEPDEYDDGKLFPGKEIKEKTLAVYVYVALEDSAIEMTGSVIENTWGLK